MLALLLTMKKRITFFQHSKIMLYYCEVNMYVQYIFLSLLIIVFLSVLHRFMASELLILYLQTFHGLSILIAWQTVHVDGVLQFSWPLSTIFQKVIRTKWAVGLLDLRTIGHFNYWGIRTIWLSDYRAFGLLGFGLSGIRTIRLSDYRAHTDHDLLAIRGYRERTRLF